VLVYCLNFFLLKNIATSSNDLIEKFKMVPKIGVQKYEEEEEEEEATLNL
jgi:hypothetical protein